MAALPGDLAPHTIIDTSRARTRDLRAGRVPTADERPTAYKVVRVGGVLGEDVTITSGIPRESAEESAAFLNEHDVLEDHWYVSVEESWHRDRYVGIYGGGSGVEADHSTYSFSDADLEDVTVVDAVPMSELVYRQQEGN